MANNYYYLLGASSYNTEDINIHSFIYSFYLYMPLQVPYYSEALLTQHGYCVGVSHRSATGNCE